MHAVLITQIYPRCQICGALEKIHERALTPLGLCPQGEWSYVGARDSFRLNWTRVTPW